MKTKPFIKFRQFLYLSLVRFNKNNLWESASSCSFGFIFSFVPITLIISTLLLSLIHVSPEFVNYVLQLTEDNEELAFVAPYIKQFFGPASFTVVNFFLGLWVIWMARKLFGSITAAMNRIFRSKSDRKTIGNQSLSFISEFALILAFVLLLLISFLFKQLLNRPELESVKQTLPVLKQLNSTTIPSVIFYLLLFFCTLYTYKFGSGTKPGVYSCIFYSFLCTLTFFFLSILLEKFLNKTNYNIIYGAISSIILLMVRVYFFFLAFLLFAQMLYVSQFFESLLKKEIYLMPSETNSFGCNLRRLIFKNPNTIITEDNTKTYHPGDIVFKENDKAETVFYLYKGIVQETTPTVINEIPEGAFLGDSETLVDGEYKSTVCALTECQIMSLSIQEFKSLLKENPPAALKALSKISKITL